MSSASASTPVDFTALLSKNYRPARASRLIPREAYKEHHADANEDDKKTNYKKEEDDDTREQLEEANRLVLQLVSKTPAYNGRCDATPNTAVSLSTSDNSRNGVPKAPTDEWEQLPAALHAVELDDWEKRIMWDGLDENNKKEQPTSEAIVKVNAASLLGQRRNPYLDALVFDESNISWDGSREDTKKKARNVKLILEEGTAGQSVARNVLPPSRPLPFGQSEEYLKRYEREWTTPATSTAELGKALHADREQQNLLIEARQKKRTQMAIDKSIRVTEAMGTLALGSKGRGRTITSSLMGPGGTERTGRPTRAQSHGAHDVEYVEQLDLVESHALVKPDLSKVELRQYHRPKLPETIIKTNLPWQFQIRYVPSAKKTDPSNTYASSSYQSMMGSHLPGALSQAKIRNEADLSPAEGNLVLLEYSEERPPIQLTKGMASKIINYYRGDKARCPVSAGGGDRPTRRKQTSSTSGTTKPDAQTNSSSKVERSSRLIGPNEAAQTSVVDWIGKPPKKTREDRSDKPSIDVLPEGVTEILHKHVHGPFLGEVEENTTQTGLISNVLVAPMFRHEPESTDFLVILGKKLSGSQLDESRQALGVVLRPLPSSVFTVGQTEPRTRVYAPNSSNEKSFFTPFLSFQIAKELEHTRGDGLSFEDIRGGLFPHSGTSMTSQLRPRVKQVAIYDKNSQLYNIKPIGMDEFPGMEALGKRFSPESVAAYETACASSRRLSDLGLHELIKGNINVASVGVAMLYLAAEVNAARDASKKTRKLLDVAKAGKSKKKSSEIAMYEKAAEKLETAWKEARRKYEVATFIYEELQLAPWNLTQEFLDVHKGGQGTGMMKLTGLGDPSGQGEGFNFLREEAKPTKATGNTDGALNAQIKKITGTENDLRKLTMKQMASLLRSYGMGQKEIDTLKRWDRVHVIRDLSTKAASDGMGDGLERFARGEKMKLSEQKQMYRDRIQEIWRRQRAALSSDAGDARAAGGSASDTEGPDDVEAIGGTTDGATDLPKEGDNDKEESDSDSDEDDFAAEFEQDMMDVRETNQLVAAHVRGKTGGVLDDTSQDLSKDAREYAALKREREEEKAAKEGMLSDGLAAVPGDKALSPEKPLIDRKVVRKRITKTYPDGRQTTTFKFVVVPAEVDKIIARKREEIDTMKDKARPKKEHKTPSERRVVGHAMFEEDDDHRSRTSSARQRQARTTKTGMRGGPSRKRQLQYGKLKSRESQEKRLNKRKRQAEEADLYVPASKRLSLNNRRDRGSVRERRPHVIFADRLESIRSAVEKRPASVPFHKPVNRKALPRYYEMISNPIDLQTIRDKNQRYDYKTADAFLRDFDLMRKNSARYNGPQHVITLEANAIYEFVKSEITENRQELTLMEEAVKDQMSTKKKSSKSKAAKAKKASAVDGNSLEIDGVTVNLGDLDKGFEFYSDSD